MPTPMFTPDRLLYALDLFGTVVFAISGLLQARRLQLDVFGMLVLAAVTAIGGGTIRDLVLGVPVFWVRQPEYLWSIVLTCLAALPLLRIVSRHWGFWLLLRADALGLATFTTIGASKALALGAPAIVAISMGVLTGVGGGVIRDVFAREIPMVLRKEVYATACIAGAAAFVLLQTATGHTPLAMLAGFALTLLVRLAALRWNWHLPALGRAPSGPE
ncbi:trimeric intracellular cation channel family protein [Allofranklinella schreckenbergeri]|nr:trimeric intracellular cation channel family protein [Allofranklinella schreckenbergeri]